MNRLPRWLGLLIGLVVVLGLSRPAQAHPFGASTAAHQVELLLGPGAVELKYTVAVPDPVLRANARLRPGRDPVATTTSELVSGLMILADGARIPLKTQGGAELGRDDDAQVITLRFTGPLPPGARRIEISNGNLPEVTTVSSYIIHLRPGLTVQDSSLLQLRRGRLRSDESGRWMQGEQGRRAHLTLIHQNGPFHRAARWLAHTPDEPVALARALPPGPGAGFRTGPPAPVVVGGFLLLAALLGATSTPSPRRWLGPPTALPLAALGFFAPGGLWPGMDLVLGLITLGAAAARPGASWIGLVALAGGGHALRLGLAVGVVAGLAMGAQRVAGSEPKSPLKDESSRRMGSRTGLILVGVWLAVRGGLALLLPY